MRRNNMSLMDKLSLEELYREYWFCIHVGQHDKADKILELVKRRFKK
jgi:hypothetical protein